MLWLHLLVNGVVTGCALGMVAVSFSLIYSTTQIFHVAHAAIYSLGGYLAWSAVGHGLPLPLAVLIAMLVCTVLGALIQKHLYERLARRGATHLVMLIASLGMTAVLQNLIAATYTSNVLTFPLDWTSRTVDLGGILLTVAQLMTAIVGLLAYLAAMLFAHRSALGKRMRATASNPFLAEITRLQPRQVHVIVVAVGSAIVCLPGILVPLDLGLQPFGGIGVLLIATIAMIAGGVGSITGAFLMAMLVSVLQNLSLLVMPGEWSIAVTFFIFVIFMLFRPRGLFVNN
jgi:branched-subunit amino acid ABC-type transport system permease component